MAEESIYNLVPHIPEPPVKPRMHRSKFDASAPPSYSTFPRKEAADGQRDGSASILFAGRSGAIGRDVGPEVDPKRFLRSHSSKRDKLPEVKPFERSRVAPPKSGVPTRDDKPVMGLMTEKDFVHANAVEAVHAPARHRQKPEEPRPTQRKDFGTKPEYLDRIQAQIDTEKTMLADSRAREVEYQTSMKEHFVRRVDEMEKEELVAALRQRWEEKHRQYHALPFAQDTAMSIARKEAIERELKEIETALAKLSKKVVVVYNDRENPHVTRWAKSEAEADATRAAASMVSESIMTKRR